MIATLNKSVELPQVYFVNKKLGKRENCKIRKGFTVSSRLITNDEIDLGQVIQISGRAKINIEEVYKCLKIFVLPYLFSVALSLHLCY